MNYEKIIETIESFIINQTGYCQTENCNGVVIGLSGGIDSAVVAKLAVGALGASKVHALIMPYFKNENETDAVEFAKELGISYTIIPISSIFDSFMAYDTFLNDTARQNLMARIRMTLLYGKANTDNLRVIGTGNKSEIMVGYLTKYGDGGVDMEPIGDLYKTQVYELARIVGIPEKIIKKAPSADLFEGQTDEGELGMPYKLLDTILEDYGFESEITYIYSEKKESDYQMKIDKVVKMMKDSEHKRSVPPCPRISDDYINYE